MLKARMKRVCEANPWLVGRIVRDKKRHKGLLCCAFPKTVSDEDIDSIFCTSSKMSNPHLLDSTIHSTTPYGEITKAMNKAGVIIKPGYKIVNKDDRVTKITFSPVANGKEYVLVFSLCHLVGDGFTYYKILSMLSDESKIESLQVERIENFEDTIDENIGRQETKMFQSPWLLTRILVQSMVSPTFQVSASYVDQEKIEKAKKEAKDRNRDTDPNFFISTNDIITSSVAMESGADGLFMALNCRERLKGATKSHAGNYETVMFYDKESFETPDEIRKSLRNAPFQRSSGNPLPKWSELLSSDFAFITSWSFSSFDAELHLWDSKGNPSESVSLHLPIYEVTELPPIPMAIVFKPTRGKMAVIYFHSSKNNFYKTTIENGTFLGETLNTRMFVE